jgi:ankyrin repeat protein
MRINSGRPFGTAKAGFFGLLPLTHQREARQDPREMEQLNPEDPDALRSAVRRGRQNDVVALASGGADLRSRDARGWTALHWAAHGRHASICALLLDHGAPIDAQDGQGRTPLHVASQRGSPEVAALLLSRGATIDSPDRRSWSPLHLAARHRREAVANLLIAHGAHVDRRTEDGRSPFEIALLSRRELSLDELELPTLLLRRRADINGRGSRGRTPLHLCVTAHSRDPGLISRRRIAWLIEQGADIETRDDSERTPWQVALESWSDSWSVGAARLLVTKLAAHEGVYLRDEDWEETNHLVDEAAGGINGAIKYGQTPLHYAILHDAGRTKIRVALILLVAGADPWLLYNPPTTPMDAALSGHRLDLVRQLASCTGRQSRENLFGAFLKATGDEVRAEISGMTPLSRAVLQGDPNATRDLLRRGADVDARNDDGCAPIHHAVSLGYHETLDVLLAAGADANARDGRGRNPLQLARAQYDTEAFGKLVERGAEIDPSDEEIHQMLGWAAREAHQRGWRRVQALWDPSF